MTRGWAASEGSGRPAPFQPGLRATFSWKYVGAGATREQFIKTFGAASKRVVFVRDVD